MIEAEKSYNAMKAMTTACCCLIFFSARDVLMRYYKVYKNYSTFELSLDALTLYSFSCTVAGIYIWNFTDTPFHWEFLTAGIMSSILNTVGFMLLAISIVIGYAGPANALNSIQAVVLTMLGITMMHQIPNRMELIGLFLGIIGTIIISVGDPIIRGL